MTAETPKFIHLRVRTALSLLQSMIRPKDLAKWAAATGAPAVAVTDDNLYAALELAEALSEQGVQSITGRPSTSWNPASTANRARSPCWHKDRLSQPDGVVVAGVRFSRWR